MWGFEIIVIILVACWLLWFSLAMPVNGNAWLKIMYKVLPFAGAVALGVVIAMHFGVFVIPS